MEITTPSVRVAHSELEADVMVIFDMKKTSQGFSLAESLVLRKVSHLPTTLTTSLSFCRLGYS